MKWNNDIKEAISYSTSIFLIVFGCILLIWGFLTPPVGEIHASVQLIFGQILVFVGAVHGVSLHFDNRQKTMEARIDKKIKEFEERNS